MQIKPPRLLRKVLPMPHDPHTAPLMAALSVALNARTNQLTQNVVDDMRTKAEELLPRDHAAYGAIMNFATMYELHRRDVPVLAELGDQLQRAIDWATAPAPTPALPYRRDIDG
jgi:hypothetical protein